MRIVGVGDIMPGGVLAGINEGYVSKEIKQLLASADIRIGTLETAVGNEPTFYEEKMRRKADVIYVKDADLIKLKQLQFDVVSLANNHFFDLGPEGAAHTIELLDELGIKHVGAGKNIQEASKPIVIEKDGKSVAFLAFCDWREANVGWCPFATETEAGICPMYDDVVIEQIKLCKTKYDYVVVMPHWGREYQQEPMQLVYDLSKKMIKAGADAVLGSHTHCVQPVVSSKNSVVAFCMGNFLFPDRLISSPRSTFYPNGSLDVSSLPVTWDFPDKVEEITLKRWKSMARFGQIVSVDIQTKNVSVDYTRLSEDNRLSLADSSFPYLRKMRILKTLMKSNLYVPALIVGRTAIQIRAKLKKLK